MASNDAPVPKIFTVEEIDRGIEKLGKRIKEVQALDPKTVDHGDAVVDAVELRIRETIRDVFGPRSPEFHKYGSIAIHHGGYSLYMSGDEWQKRFAAGIPQTITVLQELIKWLGEKRHDILENPSKSIQVTFEDLQLHPRIKEVAAPLYRDGHYAEAIFSASKALVNMVKERANRHDIDGASLMREVFTRNDPILAFNDLSDDTDKVEQQGMMNLYEGAVLAVRDPRAHSFLSDSPERALEYIGLLSLLANRLEETNLRKK